MKFCGRFFKPSFASRRSRKVKFYLIYGGVGGAIKFYALNLAQNMDRLKFISTKTTLMRVPRRDIVRRAVALVHLPHIVRRALRVRRAARIAAHAMI